MTRLIALLCFFGCLGLGTLNAQEIPDGGKDFLNFKSLHTYAFEKGELGSISTTDAEKTSDITLRVTTTQRPDDIWNLSARLPIWKRNLEGGSVILLAFEARTLEASLETDEAKAMFVFGIAEKSKNYERKAVSISGQWQRYFVPVQVNEDVAGGDLFVAMQFGYSPQVFEMRKLRLVNYPAGIDINTMPHTRITYVGMEAEAAWRIAAAERIEQHRKGDFEVKFTQKGKPVADIPVQVTLQRHDFGWGAAFNSKKMLKDPRHAEFFAGAFNIGVFENDVKIKFWNKDGRQEQVLQTIDLLQARNVALKGHVLIWPGYRHLTPEFKRYKDNPKKINELMQAHLDDILEVTAGKISHWDVVNEANTNQDLQEITGSEEILYNGFRELHRRDPNVLRMVNEFGIINKGGLNEKKRQWYYDYIKRIDENTGGLVDGIGIQSHIGSDLTPIPKVLEILDFYATLDKKISISEFTLDVDDALVRYAYTRDFITAAFSHPSVFEFLFWGYQSHKADIFTEDWQAGSMGNAYFDLVHDAWKTNLFLETNNEGTAEGRGFYGTYEYSYLIDGVVQKGTFTISPNEKAIIEVELD